MKMVGIFRSTVVAVLYSVETSSAVAQQVAINEVSSVQSDRLLQRTPGALPRLGNLPAWYERDFPVPAYWGSGPGPHGFGYTQATNVGAAVRNKTPVLFLRRSFNATAVEVASAAPVELVIDYDDGFVAYLNGVEIARRNTGAPGSFAWHHQQAFNEKPAGPVETISLGATNSLLSEGANILAIQVHNNTVANGRLFCSATLRITGATPRDLVIPDDTWSWFAGTHAPSGGLYDTSDIATVSPPEFLDWIELKNTAASQVDLGGWMLTDERALPAKWTFPPGTFIPAGGYLVVACSGRDIKIPPAGGLLHTNFSLNSNGEYLALRDRNGSLQSELNDVPDQDAFHTWGLDAGSGQYRYLDRGTPGAANVPGTVSDLTAEVDFDKPSGFYSEPLTVTLSTLTPGATIRYTLDGSEPSESSTLYTGPIDPTARPPLGPGTGTILREMFQWNGTFVAPEELPANATPNVTQLISLFETSTNLSDFYTHRVRGFIHPPKTGSYVFYLATDDDGELWLSTDRDPSNKRRIAFIRENWAWPREWTKHVTQKSVAIPLVAGESYYIEAIQSDGSGGDNLAVGWSGPGLPAGTNVVEGRYLSPPSAIPPGTSSLPGAGIVRARAFSPGRLPSEVRTRNYVTRYDTRLAAVPAFFLTGPPAQTFYSPDGIFTQVGGNWNLESWAPDDPRFDYNFCMVEGDAFERPVALEIVNPGNQLVERTTVGARFAGSRSSRPFYQLRGLEDVAWTGDLHSKPQLNLFFRSDFGIARLRKDGFIPTSSVTEWDTLRLRAGKNDPFNPFIIDEWMRRSFAAMGAPAPQGFIATLFINGQFKSYFNPTERPRDSFFQEFYRTSNSFDVNYIGQWEEGDPAAYNQMIGFFRNNSFTSFDTYQQGAAMWDMSNVADYIIINGWAATLDWPQNNYTFLRERVPGSLWRFSMWDAEAALGRFRQSNQHNTFESELHLSSPASPGTEATVAALIFRRAHQNPEFRLLFADRIQKHFFNGGVMTRPNMNARWDALRTQMEPLYAAVFGGTFDNSNWVAWGGRDATFLSQARTAELWPVTIAPRMSPFGGQVGVGSSVSLTNPNANGLIYFTTNGTDPRAVGGAPQGTVYTGQITVTSPLTIKARVRSTGGEWSPLVAANFAPPVPRLAVTELHYNPPGMADSTEFIELTNLSDQPISLNGAHFTQGIEFAFGNLSLSPGESVVLVRNATAFAAAYPGVGIGGVYGGDLDNAGETITLRDVAGNIILTFRYSDPRLPGWPASPDGDGRTLVLRRPFDNGTDPSLPQSWRPSAVNGGAPGQADATRFTGNPLADGDRDGYPALLEYALGTSDNSPVSIPQLTVSREPSGVLTISVTHPIAADDVVVDALESEDLSAWSPATLQQQVPAADPAQHFSTWRSNSSAERIFMRLRVQQN